MEYKFNNQALIEASKLSLPGGVLLKLNAALNEDEAYVADELVELSEEILNQVAAIGFLHYIINSIKISCQSLFLFDF